MSESTRKHPAEEKDTKEARLENPTGILHLFQHESVPSLLDAILTLPPSREFNQTEFAEHAGVTRQTVSNYIDLLLETEIVEEVPNTSPRRYRVAKSDVVEELFELNSAACHRKIRTGFGHRLRRLLPRVLNCGTIVHPPDTDSRPVIELCDAFYDTLQCAEHRR